MSEIRQVTDRHFVAPLTDEEAHQVKVRVAESGLKQKEWISQAILEKLSKKEEQS